MKINVNNAPLCCSASVVGCADLNAPAGMTFERATMTSAVLRCTGHRDESFKLQCVDGVWLGANQTCSAPGMCFLIVTVNARSFMMPSPCRSATNEQSERRGAASDIEWRRSRVCVCFHPQRNLYRHRGHPHHLHRILPAQVSPQSIYMYV